MQCKLFGYQKDLFVQCEKNFQGEIAIRSRDIAINKKVPVECSEDRATYLDIFSFSDASHFMASLEHGSKVFF